MDIKESKAESYYITEKHIVLRGLKIDKNKLTYTTMGGTFYCQVLSKKLLLQHIHKLKKEKQRSLNR